LSNSSQTRSSASQRQLQSQIDPPGDDEIEVSVFGRGYGESVVVHIGHGKWIVVDSLADEHGHSVPLTYLSSMGVRVDRDVALIVATHWHDDHVQGIAQLYKACSSARISFPEAMQHPEFKRFVDAAVAEGARPRSGGLKELHNVMRIRSDDARKAPILAKDGTILLRIAQPNGETAEVQALSPSHDDILSFLVEVGKRPILGTPGRLREVMPFDRNDASVALWVRVGDTRLLLGADLEEVSSVQRGWQSVLSSPSMPIGTACMIKIPHHGSKTAHNERVWQTMLTTEPVAVLAPWRRGSGVLPTQSDVGRLIGLTSRAYSSNKRPRQRYNSSTGAVQREIDSNGIGMVSLPVRAGHVRIRKQVTAQPGTEVVELFGGACPLSQIEL
jgi:hypothetical protein